MVICGKKVILRAIEEQDLELLRCMQNSQEIESMCGSWDVPLSKKRQAEWFCSIEKEEIRLMIECADTNKTIGTIYLNNIDWKNRNAFIGIKTLPGETRGKGYGMDAIMALLRYAFEELQLHRIESLIVCNNDISLNILKKFGLEVEGIRRQCFFSKGKYFDKAYIGVLDQEYYKFAEASKYWEG